MKKIFWIGWALALILIPGLSLGQDAQSVLRNLPQAQSNTQSNLNPTLPFNVGLKKIKDNMNYRVNDTTQLGMGKKLNFGLHISF